MKKLNINNEGIPLTTPYFNNNEIDLLRECLQSGWVTQGPLTNKFELMVAKRHGAKYALAVNSCTSALHLSMLALDLKPGDEIIVPAFTWVTSANCAEYVGAVPVFADIKLDTYNLDPRSFKLAITARTRAVIVTHLFGLSAEMDEIIDISRRYKLFVVEDAACGIGTTYHGKPVGVIGDIGCFSFHPRKIITTGEGGMIITNKSILADKISALRNHGSKGNPGPVRKIRPYLMGKFNFLGFNFRLSDIQASVGVAQMNKLDILLKDRIRVALLYKKFFSGVDNLLLPPSLENYEHTYQSYVIRLTKGGKAVRNRIMDVLIAKGIQTRPGTHAVHRLGFYRNKYSIKPGDFPNAIKGEDETISLPIYYGMSEKSIIYIVKVLKSCLVGLRK